MPEKRRLRLPREVTSCIRGLHPELKAKVRAALEAILADAEAGPLLKDDLEGMRSFRVGRFRVIYRAAGKAIEIAAVGPRRTIYEETWRKVRRR